MRAVQHLGFSTHHILQSAHLLLAALALLTLAIFRAAGAGGIPTKLILDTDGRVLRVVTGPLTNEAATALVEELLPTR